MTWRRPEGKQEARAGYDIFQQEEARMIIDQEDTIVHPFVLRQFLHNTASRRISQDWRSNKFNFYEPGYLDFFSSSLKLLTTRENFPTARPTLIISSSSG